MIYLQTIDPTRSRFLQIIRLLTNSQMTAPTKLTFKVLFSLSMIALLGLYTLKSTCYFNQQMKYCPVLVQLSVGTKPYYQGANFLLQVWDNNHQKVYEKPLKSKLDSITISIESVSMWNIFFNYLIFKLDPPDQDADYFHIVNLDKYNGTILVKDFTKYDEKRKNDECKKSVHNTNSQICRL